MNVKVDDLMVSDVVVAHPTDLVGELRERMIERGIHALPVVDADENPVGIVTASDLIEEHRFVMKQPPTESERHGNHRT